MERTVFKRNILVNSLFFCCSTLVFAGVREVKTFFTGFIKDPAVVGAVFPCTASVGEELVKYMRLLQRRESMKPLRILEVGSGTGSITEVIVSYLRRQDQLDLVEISPEYSCELHKKFGSRDNVTIYNISILDFVPDEKYDIVISTLPFMSLDSPLIANILDSFKGLIVPGGFLSFVGYTGIPRLKKAVLWGKRKREHCKKLQLLHNFCNQYQIDEKTILKNVPPINIYHLCLAR